MAPGKTLFLHKGKKRKRTVTPVKTELDARQQIHVLRTLDYADMMTGVRGGLYRTTARERRRGAGGSRKEFREALAYGTADKVFYHPENYVTVKRNPSMMRDRLELVMKGKVPQRLSFKGSLKKKRESAAAVLKALEAAGFEAHLTVNRGGILITGAPKKEDLAKFSKALSKEMKELAMADVNRLRTIDYEDPWKVSPEEEARKAMLAKRQAEVDAEFALEFSPRKLRGMSVKSAVDYIMRTIEQSSLDQIEVDSRNFLLKERPEVVAALKQRWPFTVHTDKEFRSFVSYLKTGAQVKEVPTKSTGRELADLRARQARERGGPSPLAEPWRPLQKDVLALGDVQKGRKAMFVCVSATTAGQTIAELESRFPGRRITFEQTDRTWEVTIHPENAKRVKTPESWLASSRAYPISWIAKEKEVRSAAVRGMELGVGTVKFDSRNIPRWTSRILKPGSTKAKPVLKQEFVNLLATQGVAVSLRVTEVPPKGYERSPTYRYTLTFSGAKLGRQLEIARANVKKRKVPELKEVTFEPGTAVARGKRPLEERVQEKIANRIKEAKRAAQQKLAEGKKKKKREKGA